MATALLDIELRLNRIRGYKYLLELQRAIKMELGTEAKEAIAA